MQNSVCKTLPLAIAFLLIAVGVASAGDNAGVVVSLDSPAEVVGVGAGDTVESVWWPGLMDSLRGRTAPTRLCCPPSN